jgi:hypothetical protein
MKSPDASAVSKQRLEGGTKTVWRNMKSPDASAVSKQRLEGGTKTVLRYLLVHDV